MKKFIFSLIATLFATYSYGTDYANMSDADLAAKNALESFLNIKFHKNKLKISDEAGEKFQAEVRLTARQDFLRERNSPAYKALKNKAFKLVKLEYKEYSDYSIEQSWEDIQEERSDLEQEISQRLLEE